MQTDNKLFIYGTLLYEEVWLKIVGRHAHKYPAKVDGWCRKYMNNKLYPGIVRSHNSEVDGALITGLSDEEWSKLDEFEDAVYTKKMLDVIVSGGAKVQAFAYIIEENDIALLTDKIWLPHNFEKNELDVFLNKLNQYK